MAKTRVAFGLQLLLVLFIILNIIDFFNLFDFFSFIGSDLDFFKKLLSWGIIIYIFSKASLTKIFIGRKILRYDVLYLLAFSFIVLPKLLWHIISDPNISFFVFSPLITLLKNLLTSSLNVSLIFLGIFLTIILSIALLLNNKPEKNSFVESLNLKEGFLKYPLEQFFLILAALFFGLIIFNFFMEWFALAIDSLILILGLIYYLFVLIIKHSSSKSSVLLLNISNTGNAFYQELITSFSNKKTFFIGVSFLLTLHMLVDAGVFLVPYALGTENALYFETLDNAQNNHVPLFSFVGGESRISELQGLDILTLFLSIDFHIITLLTFAVLLCAPFYIFYKTLQNRKVNPQKWLVILFLASFITLLTTPAFDTSPPIEITKATTLKGIDIQTNNIFEGVSQVKQAFELYAIMLIFIIVAIFILFRFEKYKIFYNKLFFFTILTFFIYYLTLFASSSLGGSGFFEKEDLEQEFSLEQLENYLKDNLISKDFKEYHIKDNTLILSLFSDSNIRTEEKHNDFLLIYLSDELKNYETIQVNKFESLYLKDEQTLIYYLGENILSIDPQNSRNILSSEKLDEVVNIQSDLAIYIIDIITTLLSSLFYLFGTLSFIRFYFRKVIHA